MTKKEFKELCSFHEYTSVGSLYGRRKHNAIFFGWKDENNVKGFKYGVAADSKQCTKADLFKHLYEWVNNEVSLPYNVRYKYAETDQQRFKTPLSLNF